jgi:hypothetical protein
MHVFPCAPEELTCARAGRLKTARDVASCNFFAHTHDPCAYKKALAHVENSTPMVETQNLDPNGLSALAAEWRRRALRGDENARGIAHALEVEVRRITGARPAPVHELDTRHLALREAPRPWWKRW